MNSSESFLSDNFSSALEILKPAIALNTVFPSLPTVRPVKDKGVLSKDSPWFWSKPAGERGGKPPYQPVADGFTTRNGKVDPLQAGLSHHWLIYETNQVHVGDRPLANLVVTTGGFMYGLHSCFPITGIDLDEAIKHGATALSIGAVRFAVEEDGWSEWLDLLPEVTVTYRAGVAEWECVDKARGIRLIVQVRPNITARGMILKVHAAKAPANCRLSVFYGAMGYCKWPYSSFGQAEGGNAPNMIEIDCDGEFHGGGASARGASAQITTPTLPRALGYFHFSAAGAVSELAPESVFDTSNEKIRPDYDRRGAWERSCVRMSAPLASGQTSYGIAVWGADDYDQDFAAELKKRLKPEALAKPYLDEVWQVWFDCFIGKQLEPGKKFRAQVADPARAWADAEEFWNDRAQRWRIQTPDATLNACANWAGPTLEYFRLPPGYMVGEVMWNGYGHLTSGWQALGAIGDLDNLRAYLGIHAALRLTDAADFMQGSKVVENDGSEIPWGFMDLSAVIIEPMNAPWLDMLRMWWEWTGDTDALRALWPAVQGAIRGEMKLRDPNGDGLYHGFYEFWDCDYEQRGPKAAGETAWMISDLRAAAKMARALGYDDEATTYEREAEKSYAAFQRELWYPEIGQCGARTLDDQRYERASIHEVFIGAQRDVLSEKQAAQAFRRINYLYGQTSRFSFPILFKNDIYPIAWSQHYMPPGDTSATFNAAARCGLAEEFYPYLRTVAGTPLRSSHAGMGLSVGQDGAGDSLQHGNSDGQSPFAWAIVEGVFGIAPDGEAGKVRIAPNLPQDWPGARASFGDISLEIERSGERVRIWVEDRARRELRVLWPTRKAPRSVTMNGEPVQFRMKEGVNRALAEVCVKAIGAIELVYTFERAMIALAPYSAEVVAGNSHCLKVTGGRIAEIDDPQSSLAGHRISADGASVDVVPSGHGFHTFFARLESGALSYWFPVSWNVGFAWELVTDLEAPDPPRTDPIRQLWPKLDVVGRRVGVQLRNRQSQPMEEAVTFSIAGEVFQQCVRIEAGDVQDIGLPISDAAWGRLLPGAIEITAEIGSESQTAKVHVWPTSAESVASSVPAFPDTSRQILLDLSSAATLTAPAMKEIPVTLDWGGADHLIGWYHSEFVMNLLPERFEALPGLFFAIPPSPKAEDGSPMLVLAHAGEEGKMLPTRAAFTIDRHVTKIYALVVFAYYPIKAWSPQAEWLLSYTDSTTEVVSLTPPLDVDSVRHIDSPWSAPVRSVGKFLNESTEANDHSFGPFHAQVIDIKVDPLRVLKSLEARITSTESFMGILGVTMVKGE